MNKLLLSLLIAVAVSSCSQQKYSFRKTVPVKAGEQTVKIKAHKHGEIAVIPTEQLTSDKLVAERTAISPGPAAIVVPQNSPEVTASAEVQIKDFSNEKEWKQAEKPVEKTIPKAIKKVAGDGSGLAIAGFVLALLGLLVAAVPFGVLAIIFGVIALKSSRKGLATAAIIIGVIDVFLGLIIISRMAGS